MDNDNSENTPMGLSDTPLSMAEGLAALMGSEASTDEVEQAEDDSPLEASDDIIEDDVVQEQEEESDEEPETLEASDENSINEQTLELDGSEYDYLVGIKDWAEATGFTDIEQLRNGVMMQSKFTQNTQQHSAAVKAWEETTAVQTQELAQTLELAQAILHGEAASFDPVAMAELEENNPAAWQEQIKKYMTYTTRVKQVDEQIAKVTKEHQEAQLVIRDETIATQRILFRELVPEAADDAVAEQIDKDVAEYWVGIGGDPSILPNVIGAMELKVLYDAAKNSSVAKEVTKAKSKKAKKPGKRLLRGGTTKSSSEKQRASKKAAKQNLVSAGNSVESKQLGTDMIQQMIANGEL